MKEEYQMTEKELLLLTHLIEKESEFSPQNTGKETHYYTYPGKIERELSGKVSRVHAKEICDKFVQMGIFGIDTTPGSNKKNFYVNSKFEAFKQILCILGQNTDVKTLVGLVGHKYFQSKIDRSLVLKILHERNVTFRRKLDILRWEETEAEKLFENKMTNKKIRINASPGELLRSEKTVQDLVKELPDSDITSLDIYAQRKLERMDSEDSFYIKDRNQFYPVELEIVFPALDISNEDDLGNNIDEIRSFNKELFSIYTELHSCPSAILEHYSDWQEDNVIMPVLLLIKTSPTALVEFLCQCWDLDDDNFCFDTLTGGFDFVMEKLIFLALSDLAFTGSYPKNVFVNNVRIRYPILKLNGEEHVELLSFEKDDGQIFYLDRAFSISRSYSEDVVKRQSTTFADKGKTYSRDVVTQLNNFVESIQDYPLIVSYLKNTDQPVAKVISRNFSAYLNNSIKYYSSDTKIPEKLVAHLESEMRELLLNEDWSELLVIGFQELSEESRERLRIHLDMISRTSDSLNKFFRVETGKVILCDVFKEAISCR